MNINPNYSQTYVTVKRGAAIQLSHSSMQEDVPIEEVFQRLRCPREGMTTGQGEARLKLVGPNKLKEKKASHRPFFSLLSLIPGR